MSFWKRWIGNYKRFGKLTVLKKSEEKGKKGVMWECLCNCGNKFLKPSGELTSGFAKSYGCVWRTSTVVAVVGSSADHLASFLLLSDIYLFVGLFYILLALFSKAKIPMAGITIISLLIRFKRYWYLYARCADKVNLPFGFRICHDRFYRFCFGSDVRLSSEDYTASAF